MFLKKVDGPRAVTLADGTVLSRADLPPADTERWVASRKLKVVQGVAYGLITRAEAMNTYGLSDDELDEWTRAAKRHGKDGLKVTISKRDGQL